MPKVAKPRRHGNRWQINYKDAAGKRRYESFRTQREAIKALAQRNAEAEGQRAGLVPVIDRSKTFRELDQLWREVKHRKRSLKDDESRSRNHLIPFFGDLPLVEINAAQIARLERRLSRRVSTGTVRLVLALLRSMLNLAVEHKWLHVAPKVKLPKKEERDYLWLRSEDDMRRLLEEARAMEYPGLMEMYAAALYTGMRVGELSGLRWSDIDFESRLITVQRSFAETTKSSRIRRVPIMGPLLPLLRAWRLSGYHRELIFPNLRGNMHQPNARVSKALFHRCLEAAELPRMRFHDLRHTFASHWMLKGGDLFRLQRLLGHQSIEMTQRYAHLAPDAFQQDWDRFGDFVPREGPEQVLDFSRRS